MKLLLDENISRRGRPPRLLELSLGNCSNDQVLDALLRQRSLIEVAFAAPAVAMVELVPDRI